MIIFNALQATLSGGIGRYAYELSKELYKIDVEMKIVIRSEDKDIFSFVREEDLIIAKGISNGPKRNFYEQFILPIIIRKKYPNSVIHYPDSMAPIFAKNKCIITVHDIAFRALRDVFTWKTRVWKNISTKISLKKAYKVISISKYTKKELIKFYGSDLEEKVEIVYNGFNDFSKESINYAVINKSILEIVNKKYILSVNTISPRKNIDTLIKGYSSINFKDDIKLVIAGSYGWLYKDIIDLVDKLGLNKYVIFTGKVNDEELKLLYSKADMFIYPSLYEGFGLPPLEAMSYGIPCIVSNATSLPEVVGKSAELIDPKSIEDISKSLEKLYFNNAIKEEYSKMGYERVEYFSWEKCAHQIKDIYSTIDINKKGKIECK